MSRLLNVSLIVRDTAGIAECGWHARGYSRPTARLRVRMVRGGSGCAVRTIVATVLVRSTIGSGGICSVRRILNAILVGISIHLARLGIAVVH